MKKQLTEEQIFLLEEKCKGTSHIKIANELGYCEKTVTRMLQNLRKKFKVENNEQLITAYVSTKFAKFI